MGRKKEKKSRNRGFLREILKIGVVSLRLGLIGFVFRASEKPFIFIFLCFNRAYIHLSIQQIGFVLHNLVHCP